jgi:putative tryptophan/tyrosine transport system substrate-binding protein
MKRTSLPLLPRREFITLLGGAAAGWPLATRAQQPAMPVVGFMSARSANDSTRVVAACQGLAEMNYIEGRNVAIEFRWAEGQRDRLPALARELVAHPVAVIAAVGGSELAAKAATTTIPIIFGTGNDPVGIGVLTSLNRPGGNITGATFLTGALGAKRLGLRGALAGMIDGGTAREGNSVFGLKRREFITLLGGA